MKSLKSKLAVVGVLVTAIGAGVVLAANKLMGKPAKKVVVKVAKTTKKKKVASKKRK